MEPIVQDISTFNFHGRLDIRGCVNNSKTKEYIFHSNDFEIITHDDYAWNDEHNGLDVIVP